MTNEVVLLVVLFILIVISAFFSCTETAMMSINRYRLHNKVKKKVPSAQRVAKLLEKPHRILGVVLIGNTFANILASAVTTVITVRVFGDNWVVISAMLFSLVILIFAEITPKTIAAHFPDKICYKASRILSILLFILYPLVWLTNKIVNMILYLLQISADKKHILEPLSKEELHGMISSGGGKLSKDYKDMLVGVLDLDNMTVNDIMVPRNEMLAIDIDADWNDIIQKLRKSKHYQVLAYKKSIDNIQGYIGLNQVIDLLSRSCFNKSTLIYALEKVNFIPEGTLLSTQLQNFKEKNYNTGVVVDEYGEVFGAVSLDDIVEEIVGESSGMHAVAIGGLRAQADGSYLLAGHVNVRDLNRLMGWSLQVDGPNTMSGLIIEHLECFPQGNIGLKISGYRIEVVQIKNNKIQKLRIYPKLKKTADA